MSGFLSFFDNRCPVAHPFSLSLSLLGAVCGLELSGLMALSSSLLLRKLNKGPFVRVIGALSVFSISWASTVFSLTVDAAPKLATCKRSVLLDTVCPVFEKDLRPYFSQGFLEDKTIVKKKQQFLELNRMCTIYRKRREEEGGSESRPPKVELLALEGDKEQDSSAEDELRREKEERMRRARGGGERYNHPHRGGGGGGEKAASSPTPHSSGSSHSSTASTDGWEDWDEMDKQDSSKSHQLDNEEEL